MSLASVRKQFSVDDYNRMREVGILAEDDRLELLAGEIYTMSPVGPLHVALVNRLNRLLQRQVGEQGIVSVQNPIRLDQRSEPQPDLAILAPRADFYSGALATADDVLLLIEVADSSLAYDRDGKLPLYARARMSEVWLLDVVSRTLTQYTQPRHNSYAQRQAFGMGMSLRATLLPSVVVAVDEVFA
ncbi:MAG: Uma2 family endonuclease [Candidatus Viridilinea halotolerans]|uniref:Uma2 family endonuclease n=1 Tax=Candidatus Viridilinea halotolerans TaxID=2491704 RepID=A0A426TXM3_9CHLR|nr:MAG: Uma2 family endonuclease [Candidatus Viridilinea halotolerans]